MGILLLLLLVSLQFNKKKSKLLSILSFIFMWIIFGWNEENPDKHIYKDRFDLYDTSWFVTITEPLYTFTIHLFHYYQFTFQESYIIISFFFLSILFFYIKKTTCYRNFALAMILISIYAMIVVLFRTTYAISFILIGFYILLYTNLNLTKKIFIYFGLVLIAAFIHSMCIIYLSCIIILLFSRKTIIKLTIIGSICSCIFIVGIASNLLPTFMEYINMAEKATLFLNDTNEASNKFIQFTLAFLRVFSVIIIPLGVYYFESNKNRLNNIDNLIITLNILLISIIPLLYISHDLYRIFYVIAIINYCMASTHITNKKIFKFLIFASINMGYWFIWRPYFVNVFITVFTQNLLI